MKLIASDLIKHFFQGKSHWNVGVLHWQVAVLVAQRMWGSGVDRQRYVALDDLAGSLYRE
ncbi:MAG: hypothetical protein K2Q07_06370 [Burkholderiaceae bacterium]|nr:hypothetical protein [Burkholderiaceae bacterium]